MATSVHSGEESAGHLATDQWQSFEIRMRRRRVERLLARVEEACLQGREDTAREAIAEIEQLSPHEPRLAELRGRVDAIAAIASNPTPLPIEEAAVPIAAAPAATVLGTREFTPSTDNPPAHVTTVEDPAPIMPTSELRFSATDDLLFDLPLAVDDPQIVSSVPDGHVERRGSGRALALAALALLVCGGAGYLLGPKVVTLVQPPQAGAITQTETPAAVTQQPQSDEAVAGSASREALPPVQVAVDEVPADTTVEPTHGAPESIAQPPPQSAVAATAATPPVTTPAPPPARTESPSVIDAPATTPTAAAPPEPATTIEKPSVPSPAESSASVPEIPASSSPANIEATAPVSAPPAPAPAPAPREPARSAARDEERIRSVLDQYAAAYSRLDAAAASAIFPGVDARALARAFDGLSSQKVSLGACDVRVAIETAIVDCVGSATWTPKIGGGTRTEPRRWQFRLRDASGDWQIVAAKVR